jgi:D-sedoheptulose 7-phosphate isomerase
LKLPNDAHTAVVHHFERSIEVKRRVMTECLEGILAGAAMVATCIGEKNGKVLICGNGGSAADSQHIAAEFVSILSQDFIRPGLPAIALTTDTSVLTASANDFGFAGVFERQVQALGQPGDVLIGISTSGNSENVVRAMKYAKEHEIHTIAMTGTSGGTLAQIAEITICVPSESVQHIQESHITIGHVLCHLTERVLFSA